MIAERARSPLAVWLVVAAIALLPAAYALSTGPMIWLNQHGYMPDEAGAIYAPMAILAKYSPATRKAFNWYLSLWQ
jgi:hypothetical protein